MPEDVLLLDQLLVAPLDTAGATALIAGRDAAEPFVYTVTINVQIAILASRQEPGLKEAIAGAWLVLNDSRVLARLHRWITGQAVSVAPGSDATLLMLQTVIRKTDPITIIGGGPLLVDALKARFGLERIAQHEPPMGYIRKPEAREAAIRFVQDHPARFVFVATGAPRSEILLAEIQHRGGSTGIGLAVGSGMLFAVGLTQRAPAWMQERGVEWLHRACTSPARLGRRYAKDLPHLLRMTWRAWRLERAKRAGRLERARRA
ncbi:MAG: glycosyl transferase [Rubritepida sp.]|nr:glycosyl transferase [Rubritepida sp.]